MYNYKESVNSSVFSIIRKAIAKGKDVYIEYTNREDIDSEGIISGIDYSFVYGDKYIDACYEPIDEIRTFKISRIRSASIID